MNSKYIIDRFHNVARMIEGENSNGGWDDIIPSRQYFEDIVTFQGKQYPVMTLGDGIRPLFFEILAGFGVVAELFMPKTVKSIAPKAFNCDLFYIDELYLPESLTHIGENAFHEAKHIKRIVIPKHVVYIGENAFSEDSQIDCLSPFVIQEKNNVFKNKTFLSDDGLLEYRIIDPIKKYVSVKASKNFSKEDVKYLNIPDTFNLDGRNYLVTEIENNGFRSYHNKVRLPSYLLKIGNEAFDSWCEMTLPPTLIHIGENAIEDAFDKEKGEKLYLHIPKNVRFIGKYNIDDDYIIRTSDSPYIDLKKHHILDSLGQTILDFSTSVSPSPYTEIFWKPKDRYYESHEGKSSYYVFESTYANEYLT